MSSGFSRYVCDSTYRSTVLAGRRRPAPFVWLRRVLFLIWPGLLTLTVHTFTLAPTVTGEDSGELITAAYFWGVPHPPGYPLWTILCGAWTHVIPFGNVAWRANLFSAACTAAAVTVMAASLRRMQFRAWSAGVAASIVGLTAAIWSQSVITEVYTLNLLLTAVLLYFVLRWRQDSNSRWLLWGSFVFGLGMCNHQIIGFAALAIAVWAVALKPRLLRDFGLLCKCVACVLLGLTPYFYLLWAGGRDVPVTWGETSTLAAVWEHASRGQYKSESSIDAPVPMTAALLAGRLYYGIRWQVHQFTPLLMPLLAAGMVYLWRRRGYRCWFWLTIGFLASSGVVFLYIAGPMMERQGYFIVKVFLTPVAMFSAIPLCAGLAWGVAAIRHMCGAQHHRRRLAVAFVAMAAIGVPLVWHWRDHNMRNYYFAHDHARNILASTLPNAMILPSGDHSTFPLIYLVHVEGVRSDVLLADKYGYIEPELYEEMPNNPGKPRTKEEREQIEAWLIRTSHRPVYYTVKQPSLVDGAEVRPSGLCYHLLPKGKGFDGESCWSSIHYRNMEGLDAPEDYAAANIKADYHYALGTRYGLLGRREAAKAEFERCIQNTWGIKELYNNVASAMADLNMLNEAIGYYEQAARLDWRYGPARWNLARIFKTIGKFDWAAKVFEDLTVATPGDFRPYGELGFLWHERLGDINRARYWWYESLRINPQQPQIITALADSMKTTSAQSAEGGGAAGKESEGAMRAETVRGASPDERLAMPTGLEIAEAEGSE